MEVHGQLVGAQLQIITTAIEATVKKDVPGLVYYNAERNELLVTDGSGNLVASTRDNQSLGSIEASILDINTFRTEKNDAGPNYRWVIADGDMGAGSDYEGSDLESAAIILPDLRGRFLRGRDYAAGNNPDGDLAIGSVQQDAFQTHEHRVANGQATTTTGGTGLPYASSAPGIWDTMGVISGRTATETRPKNVTVNYFIKINR